MEHALISLLALNGLRVSEASGADIELHIRKAARLVVSGGRGQLVLPLQLGRA